MPGLARKSGWNAARTEPFDFSLHYSNCAVCRYSVLSYKRFIYTSAAWRLQPSGWQVLAPAHARRGHTSADGAGAHTRRRRELALALLQACCWPASADSRRPLQAQACCLRARSRQRRWSPRSSADSAVWCPNSSWQPPAGRNQESDLSWSLNALTAPGHLLQGEIKNQTWVDHWTFEWMSLGPCCCNLLLSARWKYLKVKSTACMTGHRSWQFDSQKRRKYWQSEESIKNTYVISTWKVP